MAATPESGGQDLRLEDVTKRFGTFVAVDDLSLTIPSGTDFHPGERWTPDLGHAFLLARGRFPAYFLGSEIVRYLGWPGQAISYKVGERSWRSARAAAEARHGSAFDLKAFHRFALDLGPLGLDLLEAELAAF